VLEVGAGGVVVGHGLHSPIILPAELGFCASVPGGDALARTDRAAR
jgi:hypothetical protein